MKSVLILFKIIKADFLERVRRSSFLIILGVTIFISYLIVPSPDAKYFILKFGDFRGLYNSAWIANMVTIVTTMSLTLFGFYIVKDSVTRDYKTGVGQIIATTSLNKFLYILGKGISNFAVLLSVVIFNIATAIGMQLIFGEDMHINFVQMLLPFVLLLIPALIVVSAIAVLFEVVSWLRGSLGNVIYFFIWMISLTLSLESNYLKNFTDSSLSRPMIDLFGLTIPIRNMFITFKEILPVDYKVRLEMFGSTSLVEGHLKTYRWEGINWTSEIIIARVSLIFIALAVLIITGLLFKRFDPSKESMKKITSKLKSMITVEDLLSNEEEHVNIQISELAPVKKNYSFMEMMKMECCLKFKQIPWWWMIVAAVFLILQLVTPIGISKVMLTIAWIWPMLLWSDMGTRESQFNTYQYVYSSPRMLSRQLPAIWMTGVIVALTTGIGTAVRLGISGDWMSLLAWGVGALFIPSMALAFGVLFKTRKMFECIYLIIVFIGEVRRDYWFFDFAGITKASIERGTPVIFGVSTLLLCLIAIYGRWRQLNT